MRLARFWIRQPGEAIGPDGSRMRVVCRGWSNQSLDEARANAREAARRLAEKIVSGRNVRGGYLYGDRPLPEPVLREFPSSGATPRAVVTRNMYGALVLNAADLMFVDIDRDDSTPQPRVMNDIQNNAARAGLSGRVYKTAAGYRFLITSAAFDPAGDLSQSVLSQFGSDPLYMRLCKLQQSFRARLTPKPWRCGLRMPPVKFPFDTPRDEDRFREWEAGYTAAVARYATCKFLASVGSAGVHPAYADLVDYHDQESKAASSLPLA
jgi:hypothetical protein